jgi:membrane-bound lytic murein transglycosylase D
MKRLLIITLCLAFAILSYAQNNSNNQPDSTHSYCLADHLDSLLIDWYLKYDTDSFAIPSFFDSDLILDIPDSIYQQRLMEIPSPIDLTYNQSVQQYLNRYIQNGKWTVPELLARSNWYFPIFEEILDAKQVPLELKYLTIIESAINPNAVSRSGAAGIWQFMYNTGKMYGLEINSYVDERRDPIKSSKAAVAFLSDLYEIYGDWNLVIAAYNCGPGTVNNAIRRAGGSGGFWDIYHLLPYETRSYVPAFIAVNYLFNYYESHNFKPGIFDLPKLVDTVLISEELHFSQIEGVLGIPIEEIRLLNPQYRKDIIPAKTKTYTLVLPTDEIAAFITLSDSIFSYKDSIYFNPNKFTYQPNEKYVDYYTPAPQPAGTEKLEYKVKSGDVMGYIATWYNVSISDIRSWNGLTSNFLNVGQKIIIYIAQAEADKYRNINTLSFDKKQKLAGINPETNAPKEEPLDPNYDYHKVKQGENPWSIANQYDDVSLDDLLEINNIDNASKLRVGQKLKLRKKS